MSDSISASTCALIMGVLLLVWLVAAVVWWRAKKKGDQSEEASSSEAVKASFKNARQQLKTHDSKLQAQTLGENTTEELPLFIVVGPEQNGKSTLLLTSELELNTKYTNPDAQEVYGSAPPCSWWFLSNGIILDVDGALVLGETGLEADDQGWDTLLDELLTLRYTRPLDGIFLTLSVSEILNPPSDFEARAERIQARLGDLTERLSMRLPVYLTITQCDRLKGFKEFCDRLPKDEQGTPTYKRDLVGWSNPREIGEAYSESWGQEAFEAIDERFKELQMLFFEQGPVGDEGALFTNDEGLFRLSLSISALETPTQSYLSRVFGAAAFQQGPFLRGLYLCGDAGAQAQDLNQSEKSSDDTTPPDEAVAADGDAKLRDAYFFKELVHDKALPEYRLATPITTVLQKRNRITNALRLTILVAVLLAAISIVNELATFWSADDTLRPALETLETHVQTSTTPDASTGEEDAEDDAEEDSPASAPSCEEILKSPPDLNASGLEESAGFLAQAIEAHNDNALESLLTPPSWFSSIDTDIDTWLLEQYRALLFDKLRDALEYKACVVFSGQPLQTPTALAATDEDEGEEDEGEEADAPEEGEDNGGAGETEEGTDPKQEAPTTTIDESLPRIDSYLTDLALIESLIKTYEGLPSSDEPADLALLAKALLGADLTPRLLEQTDFYSNAAKLRKRFAFTQQDLQAKARSRLNLIANDDFEDHFLDNRVLNSLRSLVVVLTELDRKQETIVRADLEDSQDAIEQSAVVLAQPQYAWLGMPIWTPDEPTARLLGTIETSELLGLAARQDTEASATLNFNAARSEMRTSETLLTDTLLTIVDNEPTLILSENVQTLNSALKITLGQGFIPKNTAATKTNTSTLGALNEADGQRIFWKVSRLDTAVGLFNAYTSFIDEDLGSLPAALQDPVFELAFTNLANILLDLLLQSASETQEIPKGSNLNARKGSNFIETSRLGQATESLQALAAAFEALNMVDEYPLFAEIIAKQTHRLLKDVDQTRKGDRPYSATTNQLSKWDGTQVLSPFLYGRLSEEELIAYLDIQRTSIRQLTDKLAQPLLTLQSSPAFNPWLDTTQQTLHSTWSLISADIAAFDQATPGTPLVLLETFIAKDLNTITLQNCFDTALATSTSSPSDFFLDTRNGVLLAIQDRCYSLKEDQAQVQYDKLKDSFNKNLSGQFPFTDNTTPLTNPTSSASPNLIRSFYDDFDASYENIKATFELSAAREKSGRSTSFDTTARTAVADFLDHILSIRPFFADFIGETPSQLTPAYTINVTFRTQRFREVKGNQIIGWSMDIGDSRLDLSSAPPSSTWTYGQPLKLALRWAKDSPYLPNQVQGTYNATISDLTARFSFSSQWALIELLQHSLSKPLSPCDADAGFPTANDPTPYTFDLTVKTALAPQFEDKKDLPREDTTTVFMRVEFFPVGKDNALIAPCFPATAPTL